MSEFSVRPDWMAFCLPDISEAEVQADADVIRSGWWAKGPRTMEFQKKFAEYVGAKHCIAVNSCTAADSGVFCLPGTLIFTLEMPSSRSAVARSQTA